MELSVRRDEERFHSLQERLVTNNLSLVEWINEDIPELKHEW